MAVETLSNWGKWGPQDQQGTMNYITQGKRAQALRLGRQGKVYSLSMPLSPQAPGHPTRQKLMHMVHINRTPETPAGRGAADDVLILQYHGVSTHIDALCHFWYGGKLYNGYDEKYITTRGALRCAIDNVPSIITRGILLDVAGFKGLACLPNGYSITAQDMEACAHAQGVQVLSGDILLLRTGWLNKFKEDPSYFDSGEPGPGEESLEWLHRKEVVAVGADNVAVEVKPHRNPSAQLPFHDHWLRDIGGYIIEWVELEELARDKVYEFLFVAAPLRVIGGAGSPINPLAII